MNREGVGQPTGIGVTGQGQVMVGGHPGSGGVVYSSTDGGYVAVDGGVRMCWRIRVCSSGPVEVSSGNGGRGGLC